MNFDLAMTDELLATTRAVRKRLDLDRPVPRQIIMDCIELAVQAPTGGNVQNWRWVVVDDAKKRKALADLYRLGADQYLPVLEQRARDAGQKQTERVYNSANYLSRILDRVPVHVIPCIDGTLPEGSHVQSVIGACASIFPAVWSFQLALRARGLGSVLTTIHLGKRREAAQLLGLPDNITQMALLPVAYTKGLDFKRAQRSPISQITHWNSW